MGLEVFEVRLLLEWSLKRQGTCTCPSPKSVALCLAINRVAQKACSRGPPRKKGLDSAPTENAKDGSLQITAGLVRHLGWPMAAPLANLITAGWWACASLLCKRKSRQKGRNYFKELLGLFWAPCLGTRLEHAAAPQKQASRNSCGQIL